MNIKRITCLIITIALLLSSFCGCGGDKGFIIQKAPYDSETQYDIPDSKVLATAGDYTLSLDGKYGLPILRKNGCNKSWDVAPIKYLNSWDYEFGTPISQSALFLEFYDPAYESFFTVNSSEAVADGRIRVDEITNGVKITYYFDEYEISVPVSYTINENGLSIKVQPEEIDENNFTVVSVSVAPFLCSAKNEKNDNRYLLVPSGSGALIYTDNRGEARTYAEEVYGEDLAREKKWNYTNSQQIHLPVFGAVDGNSAMYGVITSGAESSSIGAYAGDEEAGYSGVYPIFNIRSYNTVEIDVGGTTGLKKFLRLADKKNSVAFEVQYSLLTGEQASYSGIANAYRQSLNLESGVKNKKLNITLLGGVMANKSALGVPYTEFSSTTTFSQAQNIIKELSNDNKVPMNVRLLGYGETGLSVENLAGGFDFNGDLGSEEEIESFIKACKNTNSNLYADFDVVQFAESSDGYSTRTNSAVDTTNYRVKKYSFDMALRNADESENSLYLLSRSSIINAVKDVINFNSENGIRGISLESLGKMAYSDFADIKYYGKTGMASDVTSALKSIINSKINVATVSPNVYAATMSDFIDNVPTKSSNLNALDVDVPFYGMVFAGCKENAVFVNLSTNHRKEYLNALKTGSGLSFVLSYEITEDALASRNGLYIASDYKANKKLIKEYLNESGDFLNKVSGVAVKKHEILQNGLSKTEFENGTVLYVNETTQDISYKDISVKAMNFQWR